MTPSFEAAHLAFFDRAIDLIRDHPSYSVNLSRAVEAGQELILDYHTHGPGQSYCASICVSDFEVAILGSKSGVRELAHLRGVGQTEEECLALMSAFAARLGERYELARAPKIWLNGAPLRSA